MKVKLVCDGCGYEEWADICDKCGSLKKDGMCQCPTIFDSMKIAIIIVFFFFLLYLMR